MPTERFILQSERTREVKENEPDAEKHLVRRVTDLLHTDFRFAEEGLDFALIDGEIDEDMYATLLDIIPRLQKTMDLAERTDILDEMLAPWHGTRKKIPKAVKTLYEACSLAILEDAQYELRGVAPSIEYFNMAVLQAADLAREKSIVADQEHGEEETTETTTKTGKENADALAAYEEKRAKLRQQIWSLGYEKWDGIRKRLGSEALNSVETQDDQDIDALVSTFVDAAEILFGNRQKWLVESSVAIYRTVWNASFFAIGSRHDNAPSFTPSVFADLARAGRIYLDEHPDLEEQHHVAIEQHIRKLESFLLSVKSIPEHLKEPVREARNLDFERENAHARIAELIPFVRMLMETNIFLCTEWAVDQEDVERERKIAAEEMEKTKKDLMEVIANIQNTKSVVGGVSLLRKMVQLNHMSQNPMPIGDPWSAYTLKEKKKMETREEILATHTAHIAVLADVIGAKLTTEEIAMLAQMIQWPEETSMSREAFFEACSQAAENQAKDPEMPQNEMNTFYEEAKKIRDALIDHKEGGSL